MTNCNGTSVNSDNCNSMDPINPFICGLSIIWFSVPCHFLSLTVTQKVILATMLLVKRGEIQRYSLETLWLVYSSGLRWWLLSSLYPDLLVINLVIKTYSSLLVVEGFLRVLQSKCTSPLLLHWARCQSQLKFTVGMRYDLLFSVRSLPVIP